MVVVDADRGQMLASTRFDHVSGVSSSRSRAEGRGGVKKISHPKQRPASVKALSQKGLGGADGERRDFQDALQVLANEVRLQLRSEGPWTDKTYRGSTYVRLCVRSLLHLCPITYAHTDKHGMYPHQMIQDVGTARVRRSPLTARSPSSTSPPFDEFN